MRKRAMLVMLPVLALLLATLACGGDSTPEVKAPSGGETPAAAEPEETIAPVGSSRSNPAPPGSEVTLDDMTFTVGEVVRPADGIVAAGNEFNSEPEAGNEFVMVMLTVRCEKGEDDSCSISSAWNLSLIGSAGVAHDAEWMVTGVDGQLESTEFFGGATVAGSLFFEVGQGETDLLLRYEELFGSGTAYLALQ